MHLNYPLLLVIQLIEIYRVFYIVGNKCGRGFHIYDRNPHKHVSDRTVKDYDRLKLKIQRKIFENMRNNIVKKKRI